MYCVFKILRERKLNLILLIFQKVFSFLLGESQVVILIHNLLIMPLAQALRRLCSVFRLPGTLTDLSSSISALLCLCGIRAGEAATREETR